MYQSNRNPNKKQQKAQNNKKRNLWTVNPITKVVSRKDKYNRKNKDWQKDINW